MIYIEIILQDDTLMRSEEKKFNTLKTEKLSERNNLYYSLFISDYSTIIISDGYSYNGKIIYTSPNFPSMFLFAGKEVLNYNIDDLLPDVVQNFHKYLIEDAIKFSNLNYIFKNQRNVLLKGKNGLLFNINLYVKPSPNLSFGLVYFSNIQKNSEQNVILILDENLIINGFSGIIQVGSNFSMNNNYGLTYGINGHHIGMIIPEILLQMGYDQNKNIFTLNQNGVDLKGTLYPLLNFQEFDNKIKRILDLVKSRKTAEVGIENKTLFSQEYNSLRKSLNSYCQNNHSIFFKIESHSFLRGKYHYYRIYIISDLFSANDSNSIINTELNMTSENKKEDDSPKVKFSKFKQKTINESGLLDTKILKEYADLNNESDIKVEKLIRLKTENIKAKEELIEKNLMDKNKSKGKDGIHLIESEDNKNIESSDNKKNNLNNFEMILNLSRASSPSSILTQSSTDSVELTKIKNEITNKKDSFYIKVMKYLTYLYAIIVLVFIIIEFIKACNIIDTMIEYLEENLYFTRTKINAACIYNSFLGIKYIKSSFIPDDMCETKCHLSYKKLIINCINDIEFQSKNMYYFYDDYIKIFNQIENVSVHAIDLSSYDYLNLDIRNWLNVMISHAMKIYSHIENYLPLNDAQYVLILNSFLENVLENSYKFFYSNYTGFYGKEKEKKCDKISANSPLDLIVVSILAFSLAILMSYYIYQISNIEMFFLERLINFSSTNFDEYLKKLDELKKKFRDDNNEEDKNPDDENKEDKEMNEENNSGKKDAKQNLDKIKNMNFKNTKKKKSKQNKLIQKRLEKKKIMSKYFYKINCLFILRVCIILIISIIYFIVSLAVVSKMKKNYYEFDNIIEGINKVYYNSFDIFLKIKKGIEQFTNANGTLNSITLPRDTQINKPKFGNILMNLINNNKYSTDALTNFSNLYNGEACNIISESIELQTCQKILSSIVNKGIEQSVVQMGIVITSCLDELSSIKDLNNLKLIFNGSESYSSYELFMSKYLLRAFWRTHEILDVFRKNEKEYIFQINNILLVVFVVVSLLLLICLIYFIYDYATVLNSFLNFIGILPSKFISDDDALYQNILKLQEFY